MFDASAQSSFHSHQPEPHSTNKQPTALAAVGAVPDPAHLLLSRTVPTQAQHLPPAHCHLLAIHLPRAREHVHPSQSIPQSVGSHQEAQTHRSSLLQPAAAAVLAVLAAPAVAA